MKRIIVLLTVLLLAFSVNSAYAGTDCAATLTPELNLHIPAIILDSGGGVYSADMAYAPSNDGIIWFDLIGVAQENALQCNNPAKLFYDSESLFLHIPTLSAVGSEAYWTTFEYVSDIPESSTQKKAGRDSFRAKAVGKKGDKTDFSLPTMLTFKTQLQWVDDSYGYFDKQYVEVSAEVPLAVPVCSLQEPVTCVFGKSTGTTHLRNASCEVRNTPWDCSECSVLSRPTGTFTVKKLEIINPNSSKPSIKLIYSPGDLVVKRLYTCTDNSDGTIAVDNDETEVLANIYWNVHFSESITELTGMTFYPLQEWDINYDTTTNSIKYIYADHSWVNRTDDLKNDWVTYDEIYTSIKLLR